MTFSRKTCLLSLIAVSFFGGLFQASANISQTIPEFGDLDRWGVFSLGDGNEPDEFSDDSSVTGDVGVAGNGDITLRDDARITGDLYYRSNGTLKVKNNAVITGSRFNNQNALLDMSVSQAMASSKAAAGFQSTQSFSEIDLNNQSTTIVGGPGETVVLNLKNFQLSGNSTFTLQGTATTTFIINVKKQFSLSGTSSIVLSGGVEFNDVLFNVRGDSGHVKLGGQSHFEGILLATKRTITIGQQATASGSIIGDRVVLMGAAQITHPPVTSP
jgi:hypothetical protein